MQRTISYMVDHSAPPQSNDAVQHERAQERASPSDSGFLSVREWFAGLLGWRRGSTTKGPSREATSSKTNLRLVPRDLPVLNETTSVSSDVANPTDVEKIEGILASVSRHEAEYSFEPTPLVDCAVLFAPGPVRGNHTTIRLNTLHPAYPLFTVLLADEDAERVGDEADLRIRYREARAALQLLVESWTRMEGDLTGVRERRASELREDWGRVARQLLNGD